MIQLGLIIAVVMFDHNWLKPNFCFIAAMQDVNVWRLVPIG